MVALLELTAGMTVVDLGAGSGYFACHLSRAVGSRGKVIATEVNRRLIGVLQKRVDREQLANVDVVRAPADDVGIPPGTADRILLVKVWHHLGDRKRYATRLARALSRGGKVVIIDFPPRSRRSKHGIATKDVLAELAAGGLDARVVDEELDEQYAIVATLRD